MEKKNLNQLPIGVRNAYTRISKAIASKGAEDAVLLLAEFVKDNPEFSGARDQLRKLEKQYTATRSSASKTGAMISGLLKLPFIRLKIASDPVAAMGMCEMALAKNLDNVPILQALADAANRADAPFVEADARKLLYDLNPKNEANVVKLVAAMQANGQAREALTYFRAMAARHPSDLAMQSDLRSAMALASMERKPAESEDTAKKKTVDLDAQITQQMIEGTIHDATQAQVLINRFTKDLETQDSVDIRRKLAEAYLIAKDYDASIRELKTVAKKLGALDPGLDKSIEKAYTAQINDAISELRNNPDSYDQPEEQIKQLEAQREEYRLHRATVRCKTYPNDAMLHYDLAEIYFEQSRFDEALSEYQLAMRSPQKRALCLLRLGRCFTEMGRFDIAVEQYQTAMKDMLRGSDEYMEALYYLGNTYEAGGKMEKAMECYKTIYQSQANYRDVAQRIDAYYSSSQQG